LLLSMPGSPIIYYGDEIGMGDNFFLGDRNGVRTPMQWSPDRNAGFSRADPQQLYLPPIMDPVYGFDAVNVEAQKRDRSSLLNWMKRMLEVRKSSQAFGRGKLRFIRPGNRKVLVYVREYGDDTILCVVNLARSAQPVEVNLSEFKGFVPIELLGRTNFPPIGDLPYLLTLHGHGFYWFKLSRDAAVPAWHEDRLPRDDAPVLVLINGWASFFPERVATWRSSLAAKLRQQLEERVLPQYIAAQRWYAGKGAVIRAARLTDYLEWEAGGGDWLLTLFNVETKDDETRYFIPLTIAFEDSEEGRWSKLQPAALAKVRQQATVGVIADAFADENFPRAIVEEIGSRREIPVGQGRLVFTPTKSYAEIRGEAGDNLTASLPRVQGSNTALRVGEKLFLKAFRKVQPGVNPELDMGRFLTEVANYPNVVPLAGSVEYIAEDGTPFTFVMLQAFVANQGDGWEYTINYLVRFLEDQRTGAVVAPDAHGAYLALVRTLGQRTAELHKALATPTEDPAFKAERITPQDIAHWRDQVRADVEQTFDLVAKTEELPEAIRNKAAALLGRRDALLARIDAAANPEAHGIKIRHHGDYHLGQVLLQRNDWILVDFEGEPARPVAERRVKHSPLRDVAGMLRSFAYAHQTAVQRCSLESSEDCAKYDPGLVQWETETREAFIGAYDETAREAGLYDSFDSVRPLLELFEIEKALYELRYELRNRPEWASIPLAALLS
jgi:maltose alpha-D-glucosyltransferase/alpha-amylase